MADPLDVVGADCELVKRAEPRAVEEDEEGDAEDELESGNPKLGNAEPSRVLL